MSSLVVAALGCGDQTGLLVEVTRDETTTPDDIDKLRFFIGAGQVTSFIQDTEPLDLIDIADGRDLLDDPYVLLLRDAIANERESRVMVAVIALSNGQEVGFGTFDDSKEFVDGEVRKWPIVLTGQTDYGLTETGCLVYEDGKIVPDDDRDCDGDARPADCRDDNPDIGPSQPELCENGIDDDCNDEVDEEKDADADGFGNCDDCNDTNRDINPDAVEVCDGIDNDCSGACDEEFDTDGDGYTSCGTKVIEEAGDCGGPDRTLVDCAPEDELSFPGADELCDGLDNNCNLACDEGLDPDMDTFTACGSQVNACMGTRPPDRDCKPMDPAIYPRAPELCDGLDNNCDEVRYDAVVSCYAAGTTDLGQDVCVLGTRTCDDAEGGVGFGACSIEGVVNNPDFHAPAELCTAYQQCEITGAPDPFVCANAMSAIALAPCSVNLLDPLEPGSLCPGQAQLIAAPDAAGCEWSVIGGSVQDHWIVGFLDDAAEPTGNPVGAIDACSVLFEVGAPLDTPPTLDSVLIWHRTATDPFKALFEVQLVPATPAICPLPGLECSGLDVPGVGG